MRKRKTGKLRESIFKCRLCLFQFINVTELIVVVVLAKIKGEANGILETWTHGARSFRTVNYTNCTYVHLCVYLNNTCTYLYKYANIYTYVYVLYT